MAYWEVVADGDVPVLEVLVEHRVHVGETAFWVFVFGELAYDDGADVGLEVANLDVVEHAVYFAHAFACIFDEEDDVVEKKWVEIRAGKVVEYRHVASNDSAFCPTLDV